MNAFYLYKTDQEQFQYIYIYIYIYPLAKQQFGQYNNKAVVTMGIKWWQLVRVKDNKKFIALGRLPERCHSIEGKLTHQIVPVQGMP